MIYEYVFDSHDELGNFHFSAGQHLTKQACQSVLALEPNHAKANFLGLIAESTGDIEVAIDFSSALWKNLVDSDMVPLYGALIQIRHYGLAKNSIGKAKKNGLPKHIIKSLESRIYTSALSRPNFGPEKDLEALISERRFNEVEQIIDSILSDDPFTLKVLGFAQGQSACMSKNTF